MSTINLCNKNNFFVSRLSSEPIKRLPRETEDIEVLELVSSNLSIIFPNTCNINTLSSLTINFKDSSSIFTITGDGGADPENPRQSEATDEELNDPLRVQHGWYSINPKYKISSLFTNNKIKLMNMGYNNEQTNCNIFDCSQNSIIAQSIVNSDTIECNNSKSYDCQFSSNKIIMDNYTCDNMIFNVVTGIADRCNFLDSTFFLKEIKSDNNKYVSCTLNINENNYFTNDNMYKTRISSDSTSTGNYFLNTKFSGCNIDLNVLEINSGSTTGSTFICDIINIPKRFIFDNSFLQTKTGLYIDIININSVLVFDSVDTLILDNRSGIVNIEGFIPSFDRKFIPTTYSVTRSGIFLIGTPPELEGSTIIVGPEYSIGPMSIINNNGTLNIKSAFISRGTNYSSGIISGDNFSYLRGFDNFGVINSNCFLYDDAINNGTISNAVLLNSTNVGYINKASFMGLSINEGTVSEANFYDSSINSGLLFNNNAQYKFYDNSTNYGTIQNATVYFYDKSSHRGTGSGTLHFGSGSTNYGFADIAYFYSGSFNLGTVNSGFFHPSVTATGIVGVFVSDSSLI
jgi:hypothetical protein